MFKLKFILLVGLMLGLSSFCAAEEAEPASEVEKKESPWLITPTFSRDPKIGTSFGLMGGYLHKFDPNSTSSMFGASVTYSNTESLLGGVIGRMYFDADTKRLNIFGGGGEIHNDYQDYLGTGLSMSTTDTIKGIFTRYLQQVDGHWFFGIQGIYGNYVISGDNSFSDAILEFIGLTGFDTAAVGLVGQYDDRDNQNSSSQGRSFLIHNLAHRKSLGGEENFDALHAEYKQFWSHGDGHVLAGRLVGRWTWDAPLGGYSSINLRGYTQGQYLAPHSSIIEVEERLHIKGRFGAKFFGGIACLYGEKENRDDNSSNWYPSIGLGAQYLIKESEKIVVSLEYAKGSSDNNAFYIRFGQEF